MFPLLLKDGHGLNYFILAFVYHLLVEDHSSSRAKEYMRYVRIHTLFTTSLPNKALYAAMGVVHLLLAYVTPPSKYVV